MIYGSVRPLRRNGVRMACVWLPHFPIAIERRERLAVAAVQDCWRIDDEWWRERPVSRVYFQVLLGDGRVMTVYRELASRRWWKQAT